MASGGSSQKKPRLEKPSPQVQEEQDDIDFFDDRDTAAELDEHLRDTTGRGEADRCDDDMSFLSSQSAAVPWKEWSVEEVAQKLTEWGIPEDTVQKFRDHRIEGKILGRITEDHIRDVLGIHELGTQLRVQEFLEKLTFQTFDRLCLQETKVFNDPVHGHMEFHPLCVAIIDTPQFQRLRYLKQLGVCYFIYPGACHHRFEHSLGVCFLAGQLVSALRKRQPGLGISARDVLCVQIAGLCHDLGHGPFSHMFEKQFIPTARPDKKWEHEDASIDMFKHLVTENRLESLFEQFGIFAAERVFIMEQISGRKLTKTDSGEMTHYYGSTSKKSFLYEIVANKRNGVDVDKWDYFKRDCLHLGINSSFDHTRFIQFSRVIKVGHELQICVRDKEAFNMCEMFHTRHALHRRAYQHRVVQAIEIMLVEAMKEADKYILTPGKKKVGGGNEGSRQVHSDPREKRLVEAMKEADKNIPTRGEEREMLPISGCIDDMEAYVHLTDTIFQRILLSDDSRVQKARNILQDIQRRKLYKCVGETEPITAKDIIEKNGDTIKQEILGELTHRKEQVEELELETSRFVVQIAKLDFGGDDQNPVSNLCFFSKVDKNEAKPVSASKISFVVPQELFKEQLMRLYLRPTQDEEADEQRLGLLREGFELWCQKNNLSKPKEISLIALTPYNTPDRPVPPTKPISETKSRHSITL